MAIETVRTSVIPYASLRDATRIRSELWRCGWVRIDGVPAAKEVVEAILEQLGSLQPQYGGRICWDVIPKCPGQGTSIGNSKIDFHTELAEFPEPPRYVALYCLRPSQKGGALMLLDLRTLIDRLPPALMEALLRDPVTVRCEDAIAEVHGHRAFSAPPLSRRSDALLLRYDPMPSGGTLSEALNELTTLIDEFRPGHLVEFVQPAGSLVIWDNWCVVHGRTAFEGAERHLWRYCIKPRPDAL